MNAISILKKITTLCLLMQLLSINPLWAQEGQMPVYVLSIQDAIRLAKENNDWISIAKLKTESSLSDLREVKSHALPHITAAADGMKLSDVTLFENGLSNSETIPAPPVSYKASVALEAGFNLYSGGKHEAEIQEYEIKTKLADINLKEQTGNIALQVIQNYLEILRLSRLDTLYKEQVKKEDSRLKNINSFYKNGKVTKSDVLRAEINLSNQQFAKKENQSNITIYNDRLGVLLHLPEKTRLVLTDTIIAANIPENNGIGQLSEDNSYSILMAKQYTELQQAKIKSAKSNYYPSIELITGYEYNYPNNLVFPPVDQIYAFGFVGFKMRYSLSSLYQNNHKVHSEKQRLQEMKTTENATKDKVKLQVSTLSIKIGDMAEKINIAQKNIEQSRVNYKIVNTKYSNQLALLTDLLDADNLYLQSKYKLIEAQTDLQNYYYQLLYTTGNL